MRAEKEKSSNFVFFFFLVCPVMMIMIMTYQSMAKVSSLLLVSICVRVCCVRAMSLPAIMIYLRQPLRTIADESFFSSSATHKWPFLSSLLHCGAVDSNLPGNLLGWVATRAKVQFTRTAHAQNKYPFFNHNRQLSNFCGIEITFRADLNGNHELEPQSQHTRL